jgi:uncharacterized protein (TIGR02246 family)
MSTSATLPVSAETEIRELIAAWEKAAQTKDMNGIMARHTPDMVAFDVIPPLRFDGAATYAKHWENCLKYMPGPAIFELRDLKIVAGEEVAFATALLHCGGTQADGTVCEGDARTTLGFQKIDGKWHFAHEHHSMPIAMPDETAVATPNA